MSIKGSLIKLFDKTQIALNTMGYQGRESVDFMLTFLFWKFLSDTAGSNSGFNNPGSQTHFHTVDRNLTNQRIDEQIKSILQQWTKANDFDGLLEINFRGLNNQLLHNILHYWMNTFKELPVDFWTKENVDISIDSMSEFLYTQYPEAHRLFAPKAVEYLMAKSHDPSTVTGGGIYDPFCRNGSMLLMMEDSNTSKFIQGITPDSVASKFARIYTLMRHSRALIRQASIDTLPNPGRKFDVILANPPFDKIPETQAAPQGPWSSEFKSNRGTVRYITHCLDHLSEKGRMSIIVPTGFLPGVGQLKKLRQRITEDNLLEAVIQLPSKVFYGTGVSAAILILSKTKNSDKTLFINASDFGTRERDRTTLSMADVDMFLRLFRDFKEKGNTASHEKIAHALTVDQILNKNSDWLFVEPRLPIKRRELSDVIEECHQLEQELKEIEEALEREMNSN